VELSRRVGISAPPCLRRVKRLEDSGIIKGYRALLNTPALGFPGGRLLPDRPAAPVRRRTQGLRRKGQDLEHGAARLDGVGRDRLPAPLRGKDLTTFQTFVIEELTSTPNVDTVRTALTIRQIKDEGLVAIGETDG
jgi:DNA-binding Lrp family transcriptional regulator